MLRKHELLKAAWTAAAVFIHASLGTLAAEDWVPIIGANAPNGGAYLVKRFDLPRTSVVTGVAFVNNDDRSVFPRVLLLCGPLRTVAEAAVLAGAENVRSTAEHRVHVNFPPTVLEGGGEFYVAVELPPSRGVRGMGDGAGIVAMERDMSKPPNSYFVSAVGRHLGEMDVEYRMRLLFETVAKTGSEDDARLDDDPLPTVVSARVYPNPSNPVLTVEFGVPRDSFVELTMYDVAGRRVRSLVRESLARGLHRRMWDGRDDQGHAVATGIYIAKLSAGDDVLTRKVVVAK